MEIMCFEFDKFLLCPSEKSVLCGDVELDIKGKDFEVLHLLLEARGGLVNKRDLMDTVWEGHDSYETSLTVSIANIRKFLGAYSNKKIIRTVHRHGYKIAVPVRQVSKSLYDVNDVDPSPHKSQSLSNHSSSSYESTVWLALRVLLAVLTVIFLSIASVRFLQLKSEEFDYSWLLPSGVFFTLFLTVEVVRRQSKFPFPGLIAAISNALFLILLYFVITTDDHRTKDLLIFADGLVFGLAQGILLGKVLARLSSV